MAEHWRTFDLRLEVDTNKQTYTVAWDSGDDEEMNLDDLPGLLRQWLLDGGWIEPRCDTCRDTERVPWMSEGDPNHYQEPDDEGNLPCPDCSTVTVVHDGGGARQVFFSPGTGASWLREVRKEYRPGEDHPQTYVGEWEADQTAEQHYARGWQAGREYEREVMDADPEPPPPPTQWELFKAAAKRWYDR